VNLAQNIERDAILNSTNPKCW